MQIDIQTLGFTLTNALREHTHSRLGFALAHGAETIDRVTVRLSDINGPRGGADKRCHIHVAVAHQADVVIEDIQADLYVAIDHATDRAGRALARQIERQRSRTNRRTGSMKATWTGSAAPRNTAPGADMSPPGSGLAAACDA